MNIACPECTTLYRVDPDRIPAGGVAASCRECGTAFRVDETLGPEAPGETVVAPRVDRAPTTAQPEGPGDGSGQADGAHDGPRDEAEAVDETVDEAVPEATPDAEDTDTVEASGTAESDGTPGRSAATEPAEAEEPDGADEESGPGEEEPPAFGPQDPKTRARRLARALVSDIKVYHPDKWEEAKAEGTLRADFRDEILKSWDEYVEQVGEKMAKNTPYFRDALNEILAQGEHVF